MRSGILILIGVAIGFAICAIWFGRRTKTPIEATTAPVTPAAVAKPVYDSSEAWNLEPEFPGLKPLYEKADPSNSSVMRGYTLPGQREDPSLGPMLTTDAGPDLYPQLNPRGIFEINIYKQDLRPGSSERLLYSDAGMVIFESRYDGPPNKPDLRFLSLVRISRHEERRIIAFVSYITEASAYIETDAAKIQDKLRLLKMR